MIRSRFTIGLTFLLLTGLLVTTVPAGWKRVQRVPIYDAQKAARYPSLARVNKDSLLVVFTRQTAEQETSGLGDLLLMRSEDRGQTWSNAEVIYPGRVGEPRAAGTMTKLKNGDLVLPIAVMGKQQTTCQVRVILSADSGT